MVKKFLKENYGALLLAVLVGLIYFLPNLIIASLRGEIVPNLEEIFSYGVKIREVIDGHLTDGDPYLAEYKGIFTTWDYYPLSLPVGFLFNLFRLTNPWDIFVWLDILLPPISFFIIYRLFIYITRNTWWSAFSALIFIAFPSIQAFKSFFSQTIFHGNFLINAFVVLERAFNTDFSRIFVPGLTMIFFSFFLLYFHKLIAENKRGKISIVCGLFFGFLFYVYFYYWVFAVIVFGIAMMLSLLFLREKFASIVKAFLVGALISIPHWIRYFLLSESTFFADYIDRVGIERTRALRFDSIDFVLLVAVIIALYIVLRKRIGQAIVLYVVSLLAATVIVLNLQVFVGFNPQPDHWGSRVNAYIVALCLCILLFFIFDTVIAKNRKRTRQIIFIVMSFLILGGVSAQTKYAASFAYEPSISPAYHEAFMWINENIRRDAVFISPSIRTRMLIPFFTHANMYAPEACLTLAGESEVIERHLETYAAFHAPKDLLLVSFSDRTTDLKYTNPIFNAEIGTDFSIFCAKQRNDSGAVADTRGALPSSTRDSLVLEYENKTRIEMNFNQLSHRADYIFFGKGEKLISRIKPEADKTLELVFSNTEVQIFKIVKDENL